MFNKSLMRFSRFALKNRQRRKEHCAFTFDAAREWWVLRVFKILDNQKVKQSNNYSPSVLALLE